MESSLYSARHLEYAYDWNGKAVPVLRGLDLDLEAGCFCCIVGPSGTGKTTLLNLLGLIDSPTKGQLLFCGEDLTKATESKREQIRLQNVGFIFQAFHLIPTLSVLENTSYFLPLLGHSPESSRKIAMETLDLLGLKDHWNKKPLELSGGQRQRVAVARAIAKRPAVVLADEPTANLDSETAERMIGAFKELQSSSKTSFIFSTHDAHLVSYAKKIYRMKDGRFETEGGDR
ncbi:MAG: ABC transporter ATP-binding protein [Bdellovibrionaceae bacterium]|nr:ABC transporter ATP-binding protein [Pseudobdellovibrionaceae bacterium]